MDINIDRGRLQGRRLFVGTPMYGGQCHADYAFSIARLSALCAQLGIALRFYFHCGESLIMRARNLIADEFLRSGDTHLMFIDGDTGFDPQDVVYLLAMQDDDPSRDEHDVVCAPYPLKQFSWGNIAAAVRMGAADEDPAQLEKFAGGVVFNPSAAGAVSLSRPLETELAGTGFMMIRRATLERLAAAFPDLSYHPDRRPGEAAPAAPLFAFFDTSHDTKAANLAEELACFLDANPRAGHAEIRAFIADPDASAKPYTRHLVSEDYTFCHRVRDAGMRIWLCPWMQLTHTGSYTFRTSLSHLGALQQAAAKPSGRPG